MLTAAQPSNQISFVNETNQRKGEQTMKENTTITTENATEVITVSLDKKLVNKFDRTYEKAGDCMNLLCKLAYEICGTDKDAKKLFIQHIVNDLGMTKGTASKLISVGRIYNEHDDLIILSHTKCAELIPVSNDIDGFMTATNNTAESLNELSQKAIRGKVKNYLGDTVEVSNDSDNRETGEETEEETSEVIDDNKVITKEDNMSVLYALCDAKNILEAIIENYDIEQDDATIAKATIEEITRVVKEMN